MNRLPLTRAAAVAALALGAAGLVLPACESDDRTSSSTRSPGSDRPTVMGRDRTGGTTTDAVYATAESGEMRAGSTVSLAFPTGDRDSSALLVEVRGPGAVRADQTYAYEITATNLTDDMVLRDVTIRQDESDALDITNVSGEGAAIRNEDRRPADATYRTAEPPRDATAADRDASSRTTGVRAGVNATAANRNQPADRDGMDAARDMDRMDMGNAREPRFNAGEGTWSIDRLNPGESRTFRVDAVARGAGNHHFCVTADYTPYACVMTSVTQPELQITKTGPVEVLACEPIQYTIEITNTGIGAARNVVIREELPAGLRTAEGQSSVELNVGTLEAGQTQRFTVNATATRSGEFTNTAVATGEGGLRTEASATTAIREVRLELTKSGPEQDYIGVPLEYQITVTNVGDAPARDVIVEERLADGATFIRADNNGRPDGGRVTWNLGTLAPGESRTVNMEMSGGNRGTLTNTAIARAYCANEVQTSIRTDLVGIPGLLLEVVDNNDPVRIGNETTYTITVTNQGSAVATNVAILAQLEQSVSFVGAGGATQHRAEGDVVTFEPFASLAAGDAVTWTVTVRGAGEADSRFYVEMKSDQLERAVRETESTNVYRGR